MAGAGEFKPARGGKDCDEKDGGWGIKSTRYDYIWKGDIDEDDYPDEACDPRYHGNAQIDNLFFDSSFRKPFHRVQRVSVTSISSFPQRIYKNVMESKKNICTFKIFRNDQIYL